MSQINWKQITLSAIASLIISTLAVSALILYVPAFQDALRGPRGEQGHEGEIGPQGEQGLIGPVFNDTREWHWVYTFREEDLLIRETDFLNMTYLDPINYTSEVFEVQGKELRLRWDADSASIGSYIWIRLIHANGTQYAYRASSGLSALSGDLRITEPGEYYLVVYAKYMAQIRVTVWDYY